MSSAKEFQYYAEPFFGKALHHQAFAHDLRYSPLQFQESRNPHLLSSITVPPTARSIGFWFHTRKNTMPSTVPLLFWLQSSFGHPGHQPNSSARTALLPMDWQESKYFVME